jgi:hypothetical protein
MVVRLRGSCDPLQQTTLEEDEARLHFVLENASSLYHEEYLSVRSERDFADRTMGRHVQSQSDVGRMFLEERGDYW